MIPFHRPTLTGREQENLAAVLHTGDLAGGGRFTKACQAWLKERLGTPALLTQSCTSALELAALLTDLRPGDEVIMPSYTFVSTASAVVLRGATPVFVDIRPDTLNIDEAAIEAAIGPRTRAIWVVHYAGVCAEMRPILDLARSHGLSVVEDAAQAMGARYHDRSAGTMGDLGTLSFHATKNLTSGEGGALLLGDHALAPRAEILWEKGTNRSAFVRGEVDKYAWVDVGSSFLPSELTAAVLEAQLSGWADLQTWRMAGWRRYHEALLPLEAAEKLRRPTVPAHCTHNGHLYYILLPSESKRNAALDALRAAGIGASFHYVPLHTAPAGRRHGRTAGPLIHTEACANRLLRLPLWSAMPIEAQEKVLEILFRHLAA